MDMATTKSEALRRINEPIKKTPAVLQPLLDRSDSTVVVDVGDESGDNDDDTLLVTILNTGFNSAGHLANLLPTGTFLLFQIFVPIVSNSGSCDSDVDTSLTIALLIVCGLLVLVTTFTDSFTTRTGKVHYGIVTWFGLWTPQLSRNYAIGDGFKWQWRDLFHAVSSVTVFYTSTVFSSDVRYCFYPDLTDRTSNLVCNLVPPLAGFVISILFILFPTKRHGVGYPITAALLASVQAALDNVKADQEAVSTIPTSASETAAAPVTGDVAAAAPVTGDVAAAAPVTGDTTTQAQAP